MTTAAGRKCAPGCENILMADTCVQPCAKSGAFESNSQTFRRHLVRHAFPERNVPFDVPRSNHSPVAVSPSKPPLAAASSGGPGGTACPSRLDPGSGDPARSRACKPAGDCPGNHRPVFVRSGRRSVQRSGDRRPACSWPEPSRWRSWRRKKSR